MDRQYVRAMGAAELEHEYTINKQAYSAASILAAPDAPASGAVPNTVMSEWLGDAAADSIRKCGEFVARLSVQQTSWDTSLDIVALATGGAAAVAVLPATTAAALAAGSTFATGTRALIDADIYGKVGANLIASEIMQEYDPVMSGYLKSLNVSSKADFVGKYATLLQDHRLCSLQMALNSLNKKSAGASTRPPVLSASSLQDKQTYTLIGGGEVTLAINADKVVLNGYTGNPTVSRAAATAILNGAQAVLESK
ncbi:hypothetical protein BCO18175_07302 [Burkholderia contaminans]|nr:hypothetical protein BCO18175_07302 [Burkholderia contaminans]